MRTGGGGFGGLAEGLGWVGLSVCGLLLGEAVAAH